MRFWLCCNDIFVDLKLDLQQFIFGGYTQEDMAFYIFSNKSRERVHTTVLHICAMWRH